MIGYSIRRILAAIPVVIGVMIVTFALARMIPGDPCTAMLGEKATPALCQQFMHAKGLDQPILVQFAIYFKDVLTGNFGNSIPYSRPVLTIMVERLPMTIELSLAAFLVAIIVGIPAGILSARYHNSMVDVGTMIGANIGVSMPVFWLGLMLAFLFAVMLKNTPFWLPPSARLSSGINAVPFYEVYGWNVTKDSPSYPVLYFFANLYIFNSIITLNIPVLFDALKHLLLPALALGTIPMSIIARMTRSSLLEVLGLDYVRTARAKGLVQYQVVMKHAFRNALLPIVTIMGLQLGGLMSGAVLTETIFNLAGVGKSLYDAITARDYPIIQGFTLAIAIIYVTVNLLVDLSYAFLDPRIRLD